MHSVYIRASELMVLLLGFILSFYFILYFGYFIPLYFYLICLGGNVTWPLYLQFPFGMNVVLYL